MINKTSKARQDLYRQVAPKDDILFSMTGRDIYEKLMREIAATAFKTLLARIRYPTADPREIFLTAPLVARHSA